MSGKTGIGPRIRQWRKRVPMKSFQLARLINVSQGSLSDIENDNSDPSAHTLVKLLTLTDIDWVWLLTGKSGDIPKGTRPDKERTMVEHNTDSPMVIHITPGSEFLIRGREGI